MNNYTGSSEIKKSYELFKRQRNIFFDELIKVDNDVIVKLKWKDLSPYNISKRKNWFTGFVPKSWIVKRKGLFGIHFAFAYQRKRKLGAEFVRLHVGVEKPLKDKFKTQFKEEIVEEIKNRNINLKAFDIYPNAGVHKGKKLLEAKPIPLNNKSWEMALNEYLKLNEFIGLVSTVIKKYYRLGCFH